MEARKITLSSGNVYAVDVLNPHEAMLWGNRVTAVLGPVLASMVPGMFPGNGKGFSLDDKASAKLMDDAIAQCWTPGNEKLSDPVVYNRWFQEHPEDLYELGLKACMEVAHDFLPSPLRIWLKNIRKNATAVRAEQ